MERQISTAEEITKLRERLEELEKDSTRDNGAAYWAHIRATEYYEPPQVRQATKAVGGGEGHE